MKKIFIQIFMVCFISTYVNALENELNFTVFISDDVESFDFSKLKREYVHGERASAIFLVTGFNVDKFNKVDLSSNIKVLTPENKYVAEMDLISSNAVVQNNQKEIPLNGIYDLYFDKGDAVGTYWLEVTIKDNISDTFRTKRISILLFDNQKSKEIIMKPVQSAKHLDELWGEYFRTENPWAIKRIISALKYVNSKQGNAIIVGNAAKWSLTSNASQHPKVLNICKNSLNAVPTNIKTVLDDVIVEVEQKLKGR